MSHTPEPAQKPMTTSDGVPIDHIIAALRERDPNRLVIRNEFACVSVSLVDSGGRPSLRVEDLRTRQTIHLDAIELESLAWAHHRDLDRLLDPSATRWVNSDDQ